MAVDLKLNVMVDIQRLLDALEDALADKFELDGVGPRSDDEEQRDVDAAKEEANVRVDLIRTRIMYTATKHLKD